MREVLGAAHGWSRQGVPFGLATVVASSAGGLTAPGDLLAVDPADGVPATQLDRLVAPAGLDLGGRTPVETALAIAPEVVARRHGGTGRALRVLSGPIHRAPDRARQPVGSPR